MAPKMPSDARSMIVPARRTPSRTNRTLFLKSMSRMLAARVPVQAPVPHEQEQGHVQAPSGLFFQFPSALLALLEAPGEELADVFLVLPPLQDAAGEQEDERHRQHVADDGDDDGRNDGQAHADGIRNGSAQLDERNHGDQENEEVFLHRILPMNLISSLQTSASLSLRSSGSLITRSKTLPGSCTRPILKWAREQVAMNSRG